MDIKITVNVNIPALADLAYTLQDYLKMLETSKGVIKTDKAPSVTEEAPKVTVKVPNVTETPEKVTEEAPKVTEVAVRAKFVELSKKGKKAELKELLTAFGVGKVSDLKPEHFNEAMAKLEAI